MTIVRYFLWTSLFLIALAIASLNAHPVTFNYYKNTVSLPLSLLLLFSFSVGWLIGLGLNAINYIRLNASNRHLLQRARQAEEKVTQLNKQLENQKHQDNWNTKDTLQSN